MARKGELLSLEQRERLSQLAKERYLKRRGSYMGEPNRKVCSKCGKSKALEEFYKHKRKLRSGGIAVYPQSRCKVCDKRQRKRNWERLKVEGVDVAALKRRYEANEDPERRRQRWRENQAIWRRKQGVALLGARKPPRQGWTLLPIAPIATWLRNKAGLRLEVEGSNRMENKGIGRLARATGVDERKIYGLLRAEYKAVELSLVDKLLTGLDAQHELQDLYPLDE